jgi:hypothetical protein
MSFKLLDFDSFPMVYGKIIIPKNTILYRGYDPKYAPISDRPSYFTSNIDYARSYSSTIGYFITTKEIILYDLRYIRNILNNLLSQKKNNSKDVIETCNTLALSYGLCTFNKQIELYTKRYNDTLSGKVLKSIIRKKYEIEQQPIIDGINPIEPQGYRYAETNNDVDSGIILRKLFNESLYHIDGYIAPYLYSPFHTEKDKQLLNPEILIFNPSSSNIKLIQKKEHIDKIISNLSKIKITELLNDYNEVHFDLNGYSKIATWIQKGGSNFTSKNSDANIIYDKGDLYFYQRVKELSKSVDNLFNNQNDFNETDTHKETPVRTCKTQPWITENIKKINLEDYNYY